ncbi:unnamed protein product [Heligmosomoides polygyrus]|uniref:Saposin B-type domain-containing protein n=1 Tax=Heligmosomoides polygyrus TaxID=6339 RepID=A0A183FKM3_HELPZ|nr:unnamed protein product [Heligmosomoides polygyrus]
MAIACNVEADIFGVSQDPPTMRIVLTVVLLCGIADIAHGQCGICQSVVQSFESMLESQQDTSSFVSTQCGYQDLYFTGDMISQCQQIAMRITTDTTIQQTLMQPGQQYGQICGGVLGFC